MKRLHCITGGRGGGLGGPKKDYVIFERSLSPHLKNLGNVYLIAIPTPHIPGNPCIGHDQIKVHPLYPILGLLISYGFFLKDYGEKFLFSVFDMQHQFWLE